MHERDSRRAGRGGGAARRSDVYGSRVDLRRLRRLVGMVFQRPTVFPTMSIYDNVAAGLRLDRLAGPGSTRRWRRRSASGPLGTR